MRSVFATCSPLDVLPLGSATRGCRGMLNERGETAPTSTAYTPQVLANRVYTSPLPLRVLHPPLQGCVGPCGMSAPVQGHRYGQIILPDVPLIGG